MYSDLGFNSGAFSGVGLGVFLGASSHLLFFVENILLIKLLRNVSPELRNNPMLFKKDFFSNGVIPLFKPFNIWTNLPCSSSVTLIVKYFSFISLKKQ